MKIIYQIIVYATFISNVSSQRTDLMLIPFEQNGYWGYMNHKKEIIVAPQFDEAFPTYNLVGRVKRNGKYGYINNLGKLFIATKFDDAEDFARGKAKVTIGKKAFCINTEGKKYKSNISYCGGGIRGFQQQWDSSLFVKDIYGKYGFVVKKTIMRNNVEHYIIDTILRIFDTICYVNEILFYGKKDNKIAFIELSLIKRGGHLMPNNFNFIYENIKYFNLDSTNNWISIIIGIKKDGLWGYMWIDNPPFQTIEPKYKSISAFKSDYALVEFETGKFGYIDLNGNEYFYRN